MNKGITVGMAAAILSFGATSCTRREIPITPHHAGGVITATAELTANYKYQVYFNLEHNAIVGSNLKTIWDLGFETGVDGYHIVLNTSKSMFVLPTAKSDFTAVTLADTTGFAANKQWDAACGLPDSTAIGDWRSTHPVYIVDLGYNETGQAQGIKKIQFITVDNTGFTVRFADLNGGDDTTLTITKDSTYNFIFLSLSNKQQVMVEPPKSTWDLVFTQYTYIFYTSTPPEPYLVTGCLLNRYKTKARLDTTNKFAAITFGSINTEQLSDDISTIGYDWKTFNGTSYTINTRNNYWVRDAKGIYYKLRFTSFYNSSGIKGYPQWEYQQL